LGNLGPLASADGDVDIGIRDLDQTVIGNPAHDLIRLGLSLAMAARSSDLPGVTTAHMLEALIAGYEQALPADDEEENPMTAPETVKFTMRRAFGRKWRHLARERLEDTAPSIPLGRKFWTLSKEEREPIEALFETTRVRKLVTSLNSRDDDAHIDFIDAAYWIKGCSSLGRARYSVLLGIEAKSPWPPNGPPHTTGLVYRACAQSRRGHGRAVLALALVATHETGSLEHCRRHALPSLKRDPVAAARAKHRC
jgi:uncharacterized protein (DUF2252 family)